MRRTLQQPAKPIPFPNIPIPTKFNKEQTHAIEQSIPNTISPPRAQAQTTPIPIPTTGETPPVPSQLHHRVRLQIAKKDTMKIDAPVIGGELEPEEPKLIQQDDCVIEELDASDYGT